jgi:hypothetical protein
MRAPAHPARKFRGGFFVSCPKGMVLMSQTQTIASSQRAPVRRTADYLTPAAAAAVADVSTASIVRWASEGTVLAWKVVGRWRVDAADLARLLAGDAPPA